MKKTILLLCLFLSGLSLFAQASGLFTGQGRKGHNFHLAAREGDRIELRIYADGNLVAENSGIIGGTDAMPGYLADSSGLSHNELMDMVYISDALTFDGYTDADTRQFLMIQGTLLTSEGEAYTLYWQSSGGGETLAHLWDCSLIVTPDGRLLVQIAYG